MEEAEHRAEVAEKALNKACADMEAVRKQAVQEFAERVKIAFHDEVDEFIPSIMAEYFYRKPNARLRRCAGINMDDKQKQIEEMAKDLEQAKDWAMGTVGSLNNGFGGWYGTYMYNQGYRKQSDTVREFVRRIKEIYDEMDRLYRDYDIIALWSDIIHLAEEYGAEVGEC